MSGSTDERRERYENELVEHPVYDDNTLRSAVDAVMALANEESAQLTEAYVAARCEVGRSHREVGRLTAENARLRATIKRVRALLDLRERLDDPVSRYLAAELRAALDGGSDV